MHGTALVVTGGNSGIGEAIVKAAAAGRLVPGDRRLFGIAAA